MKRRVVVTGMGLITPVGIGVEDSWSAICAGKSGVSVVLVTEREMRRIRDLERKHAIRFDIQKIPDRKSADLHHNGNILNCDFIISI